MAALNMSLVTRVCVMLAVISLAPGRAVAGPTAEVASAFDENDLVDVHVTLDYDIDVERAVILREAVGFPGTNPLDPLPKIKDLILEGARHTLTPRIELGVFKDVSLSVALPIVLSRSRTLKFDQRARPCVFPGTGEEPTCIDRTNSSTIGDGLLPASGFDGADPEGSDLSTGDTIFRSPTRRGVDQLHLGITWAPMNQRRDSTKPTWRLGAEARVAIGKPMRLDPQSPASDTSVGRGVHEVRLWTSFAKRMGRAAPYVEMWWLAPLGVTEDSAFQDLGYGLQRPQSQQQAGTRFGAETTLWSRPVKKQRIAFDLSARLEAHFEGRGYSQMWEVFQYAGNVEQGGPLVLDADPTQIGVQALEHPGVTAIENHVRLGGRAGVQVTLGEHFQLGAAIELMSAQGHVISFAEAGVDLPTCGPNVTVNCEQDSNAVVNAGTAEVNPAYVPLIDLVGHRYFVDEAIDYMFLINARFLF
jgi:hypothetical protein